MLMNSNRVNFNIIKFILECLYTNSDSKNSDIDIKLIQNIRNLLTVYNLVAKMIYCKIIYSQNL